MKIGQNSTRNPMVPSDLAYHAWFKSCASYFENVSKACSKLNTSNLSLVIQEFWQCLALGCYYFSELESWFELLILSLAISTLCLKTELESLQIVSAVGICLAWIELIFLFGRYPFLGELGKHNKLK